MRMIQIERFIPLCKIILEFSTQETGINGSSECSASYKRYIIGHQIVF